jgi:hypothetical protein
MVASRATISEMMERLIMMIHSFVSGFHSSAGACVASFSRSIVVDDAEEPVVAGALASVLVFTSNTGCALEALP